MLKDLNSCCVCLIDKNSYSKGSLDVNGGEG